LHRLAAVNSLFYLRIPRPDERDTGYSSLYEPSEETDLPASC